MLVIVVLAVAGSACSANRGATRSDLPASIAAAGDSLTRAFNVGECCAWSDAPAYSWATGDEPAVLSQYQRLKKLQPSIREFNVAKTGAKMADLARQLRLAASYNVDYLTVFMGANDLLAMKKRSGETCTVDPSLMTSVENFRGEFRDALRAFTALRPKAKIFVASIIDIPKAARMLSTSSVAVGVWRKAGGCAGLESSPKTEGAFEAAAARLVAYNAALASTCKAFAQCRWDGGAIYRFAFTKADFSPVDYFHPSTQGQRHLAEVTWRAGYWG